MKQRLYLWLWFFLLTTVLYWQFGANLSLWNLGDSGKRVDFDQASVATVYPLQQAQILEFPLNGARFPLRLLSNATLNQDFFQSQMARINLANGDEPIRWHYQIQYQILDENNQTLEEKDYHFWSYPQQYDLQEGSRWITKNFYADSRQIAADTRLMLIAPEPSITAKARRLRVSVSQLDQGADDIAVRLYERITLDDKQIAYRWQRLNNKQKEAIVEGNIYGPEFLSEQEKFNLLRYRVQPLGALGVLNQDYQQRKLYTRDLKDELPEQYQLYSAGYNFGGHLLAVLPIEQTTQPNDHAANTLIALQWLFNRREQSAAPKTPGVVQFTWISPDGQEQKSWQQTVQEGELVQNTLPVGTVLLSSAEQWLVRQWQLVEGEGDSAEPQTQIKIETEPKLNKLRVYLPASDQQTSKFNMSNNDAVSLRYRISNYGQQAVPLRVDLRQRLNPEQVDTKSSSQPLRMRWIDQTGQLVREFVLNTGVELNRFEQVLTDPDIQLSQPYQQYFMLPARVAEVEITGSSHHYISLYTRPESLPKITNVPEDYHPFSEQAKMPYWFVIQPQQAQLLQMQQQSALLELRPQPKSELDLELLSGHYHWQSYTPEGDWLGRYLISPRESRLPLRIESAPVSLQALDVGKTYSVRFQHAYRPQIEPHLFFFRDRIQPEKVQVWLNNKLWLSQNIGQSQGKLNLPMVNVGKMAKLRIESDHKTTWYLSHQLSEQNSYLRRLVAKVPENRVIEIPFEKTEPRETLNLTFYQAEADLARTQLRLEVIPLQKFTRAGSDQQQWSALNRQYNIALDLSKKSQVLEKKQQLYSTYPAYVTLAEDLPNGHYRLKLILDSKQSQYFSVLQRRSGLKNPNDIYFEALPGQYDD